MTSPDNTGDQNDSGTIPGSNGPEDTTRGGNSGGGNSSGSDNGSGTQGAGTQQPPDDALSAMLREMGLTPEQAIARLRNAPKWEKRARENFAEAQKTGTLAEQVKELQQRDVERAGRLAMTQVRAMLAEHDVRPDDVKGILDRVKGVDLLKDGEPDDEAVKALAESLLKVAGRVQVDPDQGKTGDPGAESMNAFIRRSAGHGTQTIR